MNKQIAAASTVAQKWQVAIAGGVAPTPIQQLPFNAFALKTPVPNDPEWQQWEAEVKERLKQEFAQLLFPALIKNDPLPFQELIEAMGDCNRCRGSLIHYTRMNKKTKKLPSKKQEKGRFLAQVLTSLEPEDFQSWKTLMEALDKVGADYYDQSHLCKAMKRIAGTATGWPYRLLKPGDAFRWKIRGPNGQWKIVRELLVKSDGTLLSRGLSREKCESIPNKKWEWANLNDLPLVK
ncbi:MAG: hypothetical protein MUF81_16800 [Verrucomicrobia bacterium]|nr:hypothetical protein [Verrucomicrobiota bacterium]